MPPEMMAAFMASMGGGGDDEDFDEDDLDDLDEDDLEAMAEEMGAAGFGGGMPRSSSSGGGKSAPSKKPAKQSHYEVLGVEKDATSDQIKKAFRVAAVKNHPDKGGDPEVFKKMSEAYSVLSDDAKRARYDKYGDDEDAGAHCDSDAE